MFSSRAVADCRKPGWQRTHATAKIRANNGSVQIAAPGSFCRKAALFIGDEWKRANGPIFHRRIWRKCVQRNVPKKKFIGWNFFLKKKTLKKSVLAEWSFFSSKYHKQTTRKFKKIQKVKFCIRNCHFSEENRKKLILNFFVSISQKTSWKSQRIFSEKSKNLLRKVILLHSMQRECYRNIMQTEVFYGRHFVAWRFFMKQGKSFRYKECRTKARSRKKEWEKLLKREVGWWDLSPLHISDGKSSRPFFRHNTYTEESRDRSFFEKAMARQLPFSKHKKKKKRADRKRTGRWEAQRGEKGRYCRWCMKWNMIDSGEDHRFLRADW